MVALVALAATLGVLAGCGSDRVVREPGVAVDTAELRAVKEKAGIADCEEQSGDKAADGLPDVTLACLGGGPDVAMARLRGPMVVNLFAQWCEPCRKELPIYQRFHEKYDGRVDVLGVDWQDTQPLNALRLAERSGVTYPLVADTQPEIRAQGLPRLLLLDEKGDIAYDQYVEITSLEQLEDLVSEHLGVRTGGAA